MFGKSREEIDQRRTLKRRFVNVTMEIAAAGPEALLGNRTLNESQTGVVTVLGREFYLGLTDDERRVLGNAKGCRGLPPGAEEKGYLTLADFLKIPTLSVEGAGCMAAFVHDVVLWARQVMNKNPNSFNAEAKRQFEAAITRAHESAAGADADYAKNPLQFGPPINANQAYAWLVFQVGWILSNQLDVDVTKAEAIAAAKPKAKPIWKHEYDVLPKQLRDNPTVSALIENYEGGVARFNKTYLPFVQV